MTSLHLPWLHLSILLPMFGAIWVGRTRDPNLARRICVLFSGLVTICTLGAWLDFAFLDSPHACDSWSLSNQILGCEVFVIDQFNAPLLPVVALLFFLTSFATLRTKLRRFSFAWTLATEAITLATFSCLDPRGIVVLLITSTIPPYLELRARNRPTRVYVLHMALFTMLLLIGWGFVERENSERVHSLWAIVPLLGAILIRNGIAPFHCWITDLFEHATFGTALLVSSPLLGAYATVRLVLPVVPDWVLQSMGIMALITAVYSGGMALVQDDARRFFSFLFLSNSALVLVGLETVTELGLTGALCVWLSAALALGGFGLTIRALESRRGRLSLANFQGLYEHMPGLAVFFTLTGLASVGFPGTFGFIGTEMLVDGAVEVYPHVGVLVVLATALNGIAIVRAYFLLFTGTHYASAVSLQIRLRERIAVLTLAALILGGGLYPQPGVKSRHQAAEHILSHRHPNAPTDESEAAKK